MGKPKYTPGPWWTVVHDKFTTVESKMFTITNDVSNNDADLIAAAPDLLDALRLIKRFFRPSSDDAPIPVYEQDRVFAAVTDAIAKAEGRSSR